MQVYHNIFCYLTKYLLLICISPSVNADINSLVLWYFSFNSDTANACTLWPYWFSSFNCLFSIIFCLYELLLISFTFVSIILSMLSSSCFIFFFNWYFSYKNFWFFFLILNLLFILMLIMCQVSAGILSIVVNSNALLRV